MVFYFFLLDNMIEYSTNKKLFLKEHPTATFVTAANLSLETVDKARENMQRLFENMTRKPSDEFR